MIKEIILKIKGKSQLVQFIKYGIVGATSTILDMATLNLLIIFAGTNLYVAASVGFILGTTNGYILNRKWTFGIENNSNFVRQFIQFAVVGGIGLILNNGILFVLTEKLLLNYNFAKIIAVFVIFFWNYGINRLWTFNTKENK